MKEKNRIIADMNIKLSMQSDEAPKPIRSGQAVDSETKEKVRKLCMKKYPDGHVHEQANNIKPDKTAKSDEKPGSHSLSQLHHFQNNHK